MAKKSTTASTQRYLDIAEIKENCVILKDGSLRGVVLVSSVNFALKSEDEQNALVAGYVEFLNSFEYPFQIIIQSRKLNIDAYLNQLRDQQKKLTNDLLRIQVAAYIQYVQELIELGQIMTKRFFVVVPYYPGTGKARSFWDRLKELFMPGSAITLQRDTFVKYRKELDLRVGRVVGQLQSMGIASVALDTQGMIELYYTVYNPKISSVQPLTDVTSLQVELENAT